MSRDLDFNWSLLEGTIPECSSGAVNNTEDMGGMTPLHWICIKHLFCLPSEESSNLAIMNSLIDSGADTNVMTRTLSYTPLHVLSLGPDSEEKEISSIWTFIREKYEDRPPNNKNLDQAIRDAVQVLLNGGAKIIRSKTHNLTPLCLYLLKCNKDEMTIENVMRVIPVGFSVRDVMELSTLKLCTSKSSQELLKIVALTVKHGCRYVRKLEWNVSLVGEDRDITILTLVNEIFDGKLLPDYIPLVLPIECKCKNEIFPLENIALLDQTKDLVEVYKRLGVEGVKGAVNLLICEESMYISLEEMTIFYSETILKFANDYGLDLIKDILYNYVTTSAHRFSISIGSKQMKYLGVGCVMILLEWLDAGRDEKHIVKKIICHLVAEYKMGCILHCIVKLIAVGNVNQEIKGECSKKLTDFNWKDHLETIFELLETQINVLDYNGDTCLHIAIINLDFSLTLQLLEHNAYPYAKFKHGRPCIDSIRSALSETGSEDDYILKLRKKIELLDSTPVMLKVISAERVVQCGLLVEGKSLPVRVRSMLALHGHHGHQGSNSPPALLP